MRTERWVVVVSREVLSRIGRRGRPKAASELADIRTCCFGVCQEEAVSHRSSKILQITCLRCPSPSQRTVLITVVVVLDSLDVPFKLHGLLYDEVAISQSNLPGGAWRRCLARVLRHPDLRDGG